MNDFAGTTVISGVRSKPSEWHGIVRRLLSTSGCAPRGSDRSNLNHRPPSVRRNCNYYRLAPVRKLQRARNDHDDFLEKIDGTALASSRARRIAMPDVGERLEKVEQGLTELSRHMDERFTEVDQRFDRVEGRIDSLAADVQKLRVLGERSEERIKLVADVQGHHGETLQRLDDAVEPAQRRRLHLARVRGHPDPAPVPGRVADPDHREGCTFGAS